MADLDNLKEWYCLQQALQNLKEKELALRKKLFTEFFPDAKEGVNSQKLDDGWVVKGKGVVNREVDLAGLLAMKAEFNDSGIKIDNLIQYKPALVLSEYRSLTDEQRSFFDRILIVKPGTPSLEIVIGKK